MNATARDLSRTDLDTVMDETVVFPQEPNTSDPARAGRERPMGSPDMPTPTPKQAPSRYTYSSGARPLDGYTIKRAIGRGGFGEVYYATSDSGKEVALKLILRNLDVERRGVVQCMNLKCHNLLQIFDLKANDAGEAFVVMEYVAGPSLANVLARYPDGMPVAEIRAWMKGLAEGVAYLHDHGIVHRDLKPANLFMEEGVVKIGDYGLAKLITPSHGTEHSESIGTCHYMAPEIASGKYHKPIDIYAMGVILFEMLTGRVPFEGETVGEVLMKHLTARPDVSMLPEPFRSIVAKALAKDPNLRPQSVYDLLPADDAPRAPSVRFIGDGKSGNPTVDPQSEPVLRRVETAAKPDDSVFRINAEESVFYIGPDTRPPRPPLNQRLKTAWRRPAPQRPPAPSPAERLATIRQAVVRAPQPPPAPPTRPALPSARVRLAEAAGSMLWAAPVAAALAVPLGLSMGVNPSQQPERIAFLFGLGLLGSWAAIVPARLFEGRQLGDGPRRTINLAVGLLVGLAGSALASWIQVGALPTWDAPALIAPRLLEGLTESGPQGSIAGSSVYFGLLALILGSPRYAARDRKRRIGVFSVIKAGGLGALLGLAWPFPQPWGLGVAALIAATTQAVSPWSEPAAKYARYMAKADKAARRDRKIA